MTFAKIALAVGLIVALLAAGAIGADFYLARHRPIVDTALGCVETVVTKSDAPTGPSMADGGDMTFRDDIAPGHGAANQQIFNVYIPPGSNPTANVGDRARVCLLSMPQKDTAPGGCDPAVDARGREFIILDLATGQAGVFANGEHGCGGA
jgi:hypothetical protein